RVVERGHDTLDVFGLMPGKPKNILMTWMHQLVDQGVLYVEGEYGVLRATPRAGAVMKGEETAALYGTAAARSSRKSAASSKRARKEETIAKGPSDEGTP